LLKIKLHTELVFTTLVFFVLLYIGFNTNTTGDAGDSIVHYLYAHYSFTYPQFFFHHWAKPVFVLLTSPFAQFGFKGIVVFNSLCAALTALFTFYTAKNLKIKHAWLVFVLVFFAPLYFKLIFSGLTEYLFGLFLILGIYFYSKQKPITALIIISFLPLVRSEGLLILGVFGLMLLLKRNFKLLPYLVVGQLLYAFAGAFYYHDVFWVINKIPYANLGSPYGKGELLDFVHRLNYVIEKPIYLFLVIGCASVLFSLLKSKFKTITDEKTILILGSFLVVFVAHSIFWWLSIFNSMGLPRVLNGIIPVIALLALIGLETITSPLKNNTIKNGLILLIIVVIIVFPFTNRPQGVVFNNELFTINENNLLDEEVLPFLKQEATNKLPNPIYFSHPYISLALNIDYFDPTQHREMQHVFSDEIPSETIIIWDEWYSVMEGGVTLEALKNDGRFTLLRTFQRQEQERMITFAVFKRTH
jgi:hypothetical protein